MMDISTQFHRHSMRLKDYDYTLEGAYFITVVTDDHRCLFGKIINHEIQLNNLGIIARECWQDIPNHFHNVTVEPFVIMPNHIHGVITILERETINDDCRGTIYRAPTKEAFGHPIRGSIPTIIRTYKAAVSRKAKKETGFINIWQRNYYDHIIRTELEYERIWNYIVENPHNWKADNSENIPEFLTSMRVISK